MTEIHILLIIILILYILNQIQIKKNKKDSFKILDEKKNHKNNKKPTTLKYGQIQYDVINYDNNDIEYKYQDLDIIKKDKKLELTDNINNSQKFDNFKKNTITNLPCQQDIIYDTKFYQPSDIDTYKPIDLTKINYKERKIQDVYNDIVNNNNIKKIKKKEIHNFNEFKSGASGLKTFKNINWEYEGDDDEMSYDPTLSTISAF